MKDSVQCAEITQTAEFWMNYRSVRLPNPKWKESALYSGYDYVSVGENFWVNRRWEPEALMFLKIQSGELKCSGECIKTFVQMLKRNGYFYGMYGLLDSETQLTPVFDDVLKPVPVDDCVKAYSMLKFWDSCIVYGFNDTIESFLNRYHDEFKSLLCSSDCSFLYSNTERISEKSFYKAHRIQQVVVGKEMFQLKCEIVNWANVIVL